MFCGAHHETGQGFVVHIMKQGNVLWCTLSNRAMFCGAHYETGQCFVVLIMKQGMQCFLVFFVKKRRNWALLFDALCWGKKPGQLQVLVNSWLVCERRLTGTQAKAFSCMFRNVPAVAIMVLLVVKGVPTKCFFRFWNRQVHISLMVPDLENRKFKAVVVNCHHGDS